jgi:hypothetical protein
MIEPPDPLVTGIGLDMPAEKIVQGGGVLNVADFVFAVANDLNTDVTVKLETDHRLSRLSVLNPPSGVSVLSNRPNQVQISGKVPAVGMQLRSMVIIIMMAPGSAYGTGNTPVIQTMNIQFAGTISNCSHRQMPRH